MFLDEEVQRINNIIKNIDAQERTVIWGAAENTAKLFQYTDIMQYNIKDIVDSNRSGEKFFGYVVKKPGDIIWTDVTVVVISSFYHENEIEVILRDEYKYKGRILKLNSVNQEKPFYQHLMKSELYVPSEYREIIQRNEAFHNIHQGERVFIIGNGPSIKNTDLTKLKDEKTMVVSNFYLHPDYKIVKPDYYCLAQFTYTDLFTDDVAKNWVEEICEVAGDTQYFFNITEKRIIDECRCFDDKKVNYMYLDYLDSNLYSEIDITKKMMIGRSVPIACIQLAVYMGFKEIYLLGIEHTNIINRNYAYFYDGKESILNHRNYHVKEGQDMREFQVILSGAYMLWQQYKSLKAIARNKNARIFNATKESLLDVFEKVDYNSMV